VSLRLVAESMYITLACKRYSRAQCTVELVFYTVMIPFLLSHINRYSILYVTSPTDNAFEPFNNHVKLKKFNEVTSLSTHPDVSFRR